MGTFEVVDTPKYSDQDVRNHVELQKAAVMYLVGYKGTFMFLRQARKELLAERALPVTKLRGVLNCMRHHPSLLDGLPKPGVIPVITDVSIRFNDRVALVETEASEDEALPEPPPLLDPPRIKVVSKVPFLWSTRKPSFDPKLGGLRKTVFHSLEEEKSYGLYAHSGTWLYKRMMFEKDTIVWRPTAACGVSPAMWAVGHEPPEGMDFCGNCARRGAGLIAVNALRFDSPGSSTRD